MAPNNTHQDPNNTSATSPPDERLNRLQAVTQRLAISDRMLDRLIADAELDVVLIGTHRRITESSIQRYLERHRRP